jgi:uncharacterized protein YkwD
MPRSMFRGLPIVFALWAASAPAAEPDVTRVSRVVVAEANRARDDAGVEALVPEVKLVRAAQAFADFLARTDRFDHRADESTPAQRARKAGYTWCFIAENIAWESRSVPFESDELAELLVKDWLASPGHRRNLLDRNMHDTGVGLAHSKATGRWYAVQMFGRERRNGSC